MKIKKFKFPHTIAREGTNIEADRYFVNKLRNVFKVFGVIVVPGDKMTPQFFVAIFMSHTLMLSVVYMLFSDMPTSIKLEAGFVISGIFQGAYKLYTAFFNGPKFRKILKLLRKLHFNYSNHPEIGPAFKNICVYSIILVELLTVSFCCVILLYLLMPIVIWKKFGTLATIFPIQFPFIDWHTKIGYAINTFDHVYCIFVGSIGILAGDAVFLYLVLHTIGFCKIFETCTNKLDTLLLEPGPRNKQKIKQNMYHCIQAHQDYIKYVAMVDDLYSQLCLVQLVTAEIILSISLILTLWVRWIKGPFIVIVGLFQILQYCILGTVITVQNENVSDIIYGFSWYLLPVEEQKLIVLMISRAQQQGELNVGRFAKLNVATCMAMLKTTYSFVMMMLEFLS